MSRSPKNDLLHSRICSTGHITDFVLGSWQEVYLMSCSTVSDFRCHVWITLYCTWSNTCPLSALFGVSTNCWKNKFGSLAKYSATVCSPVRLLTFSFLLISLHNSTRHLVFIRHFLSFVPIDYQWFDESQNWLVFFLHPHRSNNSMSVMLFKKHIDLISFPSSLFFIQLWHRMMMKNSFST